MILPREVLLVLPTLNECENLKILVPQIVINFPSLHLLVIDDGSEDGTMAYLETMMVSNENISVINRRSKLGIGSAHVKGLSFAVSNQFDFVVTMDADQTHRVIDLRKLLESRSENYSMIIGSRYLTGGGVEGWSLFRNLLTRCGHFATRFFFLSSLDMSSGMRLYKVDEIPLGILEREAPSNYDFFFTSVIVYKKLKMSIGQVPIRLDPRGFGSSKMSFKLMVSGVIRLFKIGFRLKKINVKSS